MTSYCWQWHGKTPLKIRKVRFWRFLSHWFCTKVKNLMVFISTKSLRPELYHKSLEMTSWVMHTSLIVVQKWKFCQTRELCMYIQRNSLTNHGCCRVSKYHRASYMNNTIFKTYVPFDSHLSLFRANIFSYCHNSSSSYLLSSSP